MPTHEDTIIAVPSRQPCELFFDETSESPEYEESVIERCRALFRTLGEQVTSFNLSRQIYG